VPQNQKKYASLKKRIMILGVGNKAEIWDAQNWSMYKKDVMGPSSAKYGKIFDL